jgi:hypothetical protein
MINTAASKVGSCSFCIQSAFKAAAISALFLIVIELAAITGLLDVPRYVELTAWTLFGVLVLNWIAHIVVFGIRSANYKRKLSVLSPEFAPYDLSRREYMRAAASSACGILVFTTFNVIQDTNPPERLILAAVNCGLGQTCPDGNRCCRVGQSVYCCPRSQSCDHEGGCE